MKEFRFVNRQSLKEFKTLPRKIQECFAADLHESCKGKAPYSSFKHITNSVGVATIKEINAPYTCNPATHRPEIRFK